MSKRKDINILHQTGITCNNKKVIGGLYKMFQVNGIPLELMLSFLNENNCVPDWIDLYVGARKHGIAHDRFLSQLEEAIADGMGSEWVEPVISRLNKLFGEKK